jgi:hypothetical protein
MRCDDGSMTDDNPLARWSSTMNEAMEASGRVSASEEILRDRLVEAGFVDVESFTLRMPMGPWAKDRYEHRINGP